jgi:hypothetical protein
MSRVDQANYNDIATADDDNEFLERPDFIAYAAMVEAVVHAAEKPVCTREIHEALGAVARREWTLDALEHLHSVELVPGLIDRWQVYNGTSPKLTKLLRGKNPSHLFSGHAKDEREAEFNRRRKAGRQPASEEIVEPELPVEPDTPIERNQQRRAEYFRERYRARVEAAGRTYTPRGNRQVRSTKKTVRAPHV